MNSTETAIVSAILGICGAALIDLTRQWIQRIVRKEFETLVRAASDKAAIHARGDE